MVEPHRGSKGNRDHPIYAIKKQQRSCNLEMTFSQLVYTAGCEEKKGNYRDVKYKGSQLEVCKDIPIE